VIYADTELSLLESIGESEDSGTHVTQREFASLAGMSLGMTNSLVKRLATRGWVKLTRLSAKSIRYALTPEGVGEIARRTSGYFRRASRNADKYRARIELFVVDAKRSGAATLVLAGTSEMDFLIEFVCERHGIAFVKTADFDRARTIGKRKGVILLYGEVEQASPPSGAYCLRNIIGWSSMPASSGMINREAMQTIQTEPRNVGIE
jgi:DNA-binding MarR family transcriptional regulator